MFFLCFCFLKRRRTNDSTHVCFYWQQLHPGPNATAYIHIYTYTFLLTIALDRVRQSNKGGCKNATAEATIHYGRPAVFSPPFHSHLLRGPPQWRDPDEYTVSKYNIGWFYFFSSFYLEFIWRFHPRFSYKRIFIIFRIVHPSHSTIPRQCILTPEQIRKNQNVSCMEHMSLGTITVETDVCLHYTRIVSAFW